MADENYYFIDTELVANEVSVPSYLRLLTSTM